MDSFASHTLGQKRRKFVTDWRQPKRNHRCPALQSELSYGYEVHFTPEQQEQLAQIAAAKGTDAELLVRTAALSLLTKGPVEIQADDTQSVVERMRALRARIKPDPDSWTTRDYVLYGRR